MHVSNQVLDLFDHVIISELGLRAGVIIEIDIGIVDDTVVTSVDNEIAVE